MRPGSHSKLVRHIPRLASLIGPASEVKRQPIARSAFPQTRRRVGFPESVLSPSQSAAMSPLPQDHSAPSPSAVLIDTDPGLDDALALFLACASPKLEIAGVVTVAGNIGLKRVTENA